jgi:hypothetical protein
VVVACLLTFSLVDEIPEFCEVIAAAREAT